jgi:hypothetical protein
MMTTVEICYYSYSNGEILCSFLTGCTNLFLVPKGGLQAVGFAISRVRV